eukprot:1139515-Pelagomonas_calceolata.AAC.2
MRVMRLSVLQCGTQKGKEGYWICVVVGRGRGTPSGMIKVSKQGRAPPSDGPQKGGELETRAHLQSSLRCQNKVARPQVMAPTKKKDRKQGRTSTHVKGWLCVELSVMCRCPTRI